MVGHINPESAFLGPKLWSRPALSMPNNGGNEDYSVMNIDDFLSENGFDLSEEQESSDCQSEAGALRYHSYITKALLGVVQKLRLQDEVKVS